MTIRVFPFGEDIPDLELLLFRHGYTRYNQEKRYQGRTDLPIVESERERIRPFFLPLSAQPGHGRVPDIVYVSPALRARQTAELLFPGVRQIAVPELWEMDFGVFEGRSAEEMESDPRYRSWVDSMCEGPVPGGESLAQFQARATECFTQLVSRTLEEGRRHLVIVAHGGIQMAVMDHFCKDDRAYWSWQTAPGQAVHAGVRRS